MFYEQRFLQQNIFEKIKQQNYFFLILLAA